MAVDDAYTVSLLHMNGTDGSTAFTDESGKSWTANGNAQIDTAQFKFGGASGLFDGSGDYLSSPDSDDFYFNTNFTIDFQVRFQSLSASQYLFSQLVDGNNGMHFYWFQPTARLYFHFMDAGVDTVIANNAWSPSTNTWYHVAVVRTGNDYKMFIDGAQIGTTVTDNSSITNYAAPFIVGGGNLGGLPVNGWVDEFRISKGIARWTSNFTPPTAEYAPTAGNFFSFF